MVMSHLLLSSVSLAMFSLVIFAILVEVVRHFRRRRVHLAAEWKTVEQIAHEKELSVEEFEFLRSVIRRHAPRSPLQTVTVRQHFDECSDKEMAAMERSHPKLLLQHGVLLRDIRVRLGLDYIPYGQRIWTTRDLYVGQVIWIADTADQSTKWHRMCVTSIDEVQFHLTPQDPNPPMSLRSGAGVMCRMLRQNDARYAFTVKLERLQSEPPLFSFRHTRDLERTQSRGDYRIQYDKNIDLEILAEGDVSEFEKPPAVASIRARFISLSASGFAAIVDQPLTQQTMVRSSIHFESESEPSMFTAQLVAISQLAAGRFLVRARFVSIANDARENIARFVFKQQQRANWADVPVKQ